MYVYIWIYVNICTYIWLYVQYVYMYPLYVTYMGCLPVVVWCDSLSTHFSGGSEGEQPQILQLVQKMLFCTVQNQERKIMFRFCLYPQLKGKKKTKKTWKLNWRHHFNAARVCTYGESVSLLTPLGDKDCDLSVAPPPERLHRQGDASTGEDAMMAVPAETLLIL